MQKITSFCVDHDLLTKGVYVSRIDGDVTTYDLRTRIPNGGEYMDAVTMHSVEHLFATYIRNSEVGDQVIYFGPMGCRTGFYLLMRGTPRAVVLEQIKKVLAKIVAHEGEMFGATRKECGNYRELSVGSARVEATTYLAALEGQDEILEYPN